MAIDMDYNSSLEELIIPEYGRNVQNLIYHAKTIQDDRFRQAFVEKVVDLMMQMHPQNRSAEDFKEKLWKHVFIIADYDLDVTPPFGHKPNPEDAHKKPDVIPYPQSETRFRHYGNNVQRLVTKAVSMPPGRKRDAFVAVIGAYMKLAYKTWNRELYVSDEVIKGDLAALSNGVITMHEDASLDNLGGGPNRSKQQQQRPNNMNKSRSGGPSYPNQRNNQGGDNRNNRNKNMNNGGRRKK